MAVARVVMLIFGRILRGTLEEAQIKILFETCYVDDLRYILTLLRMFLFWDKRAKKWVDLRKETFSSSSKRPARAIRWCKEKKRWESTPLADNQNIRLSKDAGPLGSGKPGSTQPEKASPLLGYLPTPGLLTLGGKSGSSSPREQLPPNETPPNKGWRGMIAAATTR